MGSVSSGTEPRTIYLDQSHLSNLARNVLKPGVAAQFEQLCAVGTLIPVFSMAHLHETWKHADKSARNSIAAFADSLSNSRWILSRHVLVSKEVERLFFEVSGFAQDPLNPSRDSLKHILYVDRPEPIEIIIGDYGFRKTLNEVENDPGLQANFGEWKGVDDSFPTAKILSSKAVYVRGSSAAVQDLRSKYCDYILEKVPNRLPDGNLVKRQSKLDFVSHAPWDSYEKWPTTYLLIHVDEQIVRDKDAPVEASQFVDLVHLGALPYVDIFLCDRRTKEYIQRAKVPDCVNARCFYNLREALLFAQNRQLVK